MKPRMNAMFLRLYWQHRPHARAKIDELTYLLLTLFRIQAANKVTKKTLRSCLCNRRGTFVAFTFDEMMKNELIEVTFEDRQMLIDEVLRVAKDEETLRQFRKKKLELEMRI